MSHSIPPPVIEDLLPALLPHLLGSFTSTEPSPSLYPLLAPILRNRVRLLLNPSSTDGSWASLLTWSGKNGILLASHFASLDVGPHLSSGELEMGQVIFNGIQRLDEETVKASAKLADWGIVVIYTWCTNDPDGEDDGWRVLDVHTVGCSDDTKWHNTVTAAEDAFVSIRNGRTFGDTVQKSAALEDDDDDYWNMYDRSSAVTPAAREVADPPSEEEYFGRYSEVQSALDHSEPDIYRQSSNALGSYSSETMTSTSTPPTVLSSHPLAPLPVSSDSNPYSRSKIADRLEESVNHHIQTEVAVKQHISTSLKSLYRLSKVAGIGRDEFESIIHTEISVLSMMDDEDS